MSDCCFILPVNSKYLTIFVYTWLGKKQCYHSFYELLWALAFASLPTVIFLSVLEFKRVVSLVVDGTHERKWYSAWNLSVVSIYSVADIPECRPDRLCRQQNTGTTFFLVWVDNLVNSVLSMLCTLVKLTCIRFWCQLSFLSILCHQVTKP